MGVFIWEILDLWGFLGVFIWEIFWEGVLSFGEIWFFVGDLEMVLGILGGELWGKVMKILDILLLTKQSLSRSQNNLNSFPQTLLTVQIRVIFPRSTTRRVSFVLFFPKISQIRLKMGLKLAQILPIFGVFFQIYGVFGEIFGVLGGFLRILVGIFHNSSTLLADFLKIFGGILGYILKITPKILIILKIHLIISFEILKFIGLQTPQTFRRILRKF